MNYRELFGRRELLQGQTMLTQLLPKLVDVVDGVLQGPHFLIIKGAETFPQSPPSFLAIEVAIIVTAIIDTYHIEKQKRRHYDIIFRSGNNPRTIILMIV